MCNTAQHPGLPFFTEEMWFIDCSCIVFVWNSLEILKCRQVATVPNTILFIPQWYMASDATHTHLVWTQRSQLKPLSYTTHHPNVKRTMTMPVLFPHNIPSDCTPLHPHQVLVTDYTANTTREWAKRKTNSFRFTPTERLRRFSGVKCRARLFHLCGYSLL